MLVLMAPDMNDIAQNEEDTRIRRLPRSRHAWWPNIQQLSDDVPSVKPNAKLRQRVGPISLPADLSRPRTFMRAVHAACQ
jgi:hypothetical protein